MCSPSTWLGPESLAAPTNNCMPVDSPSIYRPGVQLVANSLLREPLGKGISLATFSPTQAACQLARWEVSLVFWAQRRNNELDYDFDCRVRTVRWSVVLASRAGTLLQGPRSVAARIVGGITLLEFLCWPNLSITLWVSGAAMWHAQRRSWCMLAEHAADEEADTDHLNTWNHWTIKSLSRVACRAAFERGTTRICP